MQHLLNLSPVRIPFGAHIQLHEDPAIQLPRDEDGAGKQGGEDAQALGFSLSPCLMLRPDLQTLVLPLDPKQRN